MNLKVSKNLQNNSKKELNADEEFLRRISRGKSLYDENTEYESINKGIFIYPMEKIKQLVQDQYNNIISAKIVGEILGTKLVEIELERLVPSQNNSHIR